MVSLGIVGATGLVGKELLKLINQSEISFDKILLFNSQKNESDPILLKGILHPLHPISLSLLQQCDYVFFAADGSVSKEYIPLLPNTICIDLSSAYRKDKDVPLVIPEINGHLLERNHPVIASPNCTTTIMLMALYPIHRCFPVKHVFASTYQAASGGGKKLIQSLLEETEQFFLRKHQSISNLSFAFNIYPHPSFALGSEDNQEEQKIVEESRKILHEPHLQIAAQCVRVPTLRVHAISLHAEFYKALDKEQVIENLRDFQGLEYWEDPYHPPSAHDAFENPSILCSRLRIEPNDPYRLTLWILGDQLLKGAALNAFQILKLLMQKEALIQGKS